MRGYHIVFVYLFVSWGYNNKGSLVKRSDILKEIKNTMKKTSIIQRLIWRLLDVNISYWYPWYQNA